MIGRRQSLPRAALTSLVAAGTTWLVLLSWRGFLPDRSDLVSVATVLGLVVAGSGALARWRQVPVTVTLAGQALLAAAVVLLSTTGSAAPSPVNVDLLVDAVRQSLETARVYSSPVPAQAPSLVPLLSLGAAGCFLAVDLLAGALRRVPLAGLVLAGAYTVPVVIAGQVTWWLFAAPAGAFLVMLVVQHDEVLGRWGPPLRTATHPGAHSGTTDAGPGATHASAAALGTAAVGLALVVPGFVPTLDLALVDGPGRGGDGGITVSDPTIDLRRDLQRGQDVPLLHVTTADPRPDYLRISVLTSFADGAWSPGDRDIPSDQRPDGAVPGLVGVAPDVARRELTYTVRTTDDFAWTWLPTMVPATRVRAPGAWRYDTSTMDFVAAEEGLTAAGMDYEMTAAELDLDPRALEETLSGTASVPAIFTRLPADLPAEVRRLAGRVTSGATTRFARAVALQRWFRDTYTYDLAQAESAGRSYADLMAFLDEDGERRGYCEQFAAAMAIMARTLDIPARVAIGFLEPRRVGPRAWEYSAHDLHAWPELYFPGSGWVRFEPTPGARAGQVPGYTRTDTERPDQPTASPTPTAGAGERPETVPRDSAEALPAAPGAGGDGAGWRWLLVGVALVCGLALLVLVPGALRRLQRVRRLDHGSAESAWQELLALAVDLGLTWPVGRSPRSTGAWLGQHLATTGADPDRPRLGRSQAPLAADALDRLVLVLERERYAARNEVVPAETLRTDVGTVQSALRCGVPRRTRLRARWWPRSVLGGGSVRAHGPHSRVDDLVDDVR